MIYFRYLGVREQHKCRPPTPTRRLNFLAETSAMDSDQSDGEILGFAHSEREIWDCYYYRQSLLVLVSSIPRAASWPKLPSPLAAKTL